MFIDTMKTIFNFAVAFENKYCEKCAATHNVDIVKDMMDSDVLTGIIAQYY